MADAVHPYDIQIRRTSAAASHEYKVQWFDLDTGQPTVQIWAPRQRLLPAVVQHTLDCIDARAEGPSAAAQASSRSSIINTPGTMSGRVPDPGAEADVGADGRGASKCRHAIELA